jgi:hypothetical protein
MATGGRSALTRASTPDGHDRQVRTGSEVNPGVEPRPLRTNPAADDTFFDRAHTAAMTLTDYAINIALILLVLVQIRDRRLDLRSLLIPVVAVAGAATYYLKGIPTVGHDVALDVALGCVGAALGTACAFTTKVWRAGDGMAHSKAGVVASALWIVGVGSRLVFEVYATHGGIGSIARFSITNRISGVPAWTSALVIMAMSEVVTRLIALRLRGVGVQALANGAPLPASALAGSMAA